MTDLAVSRRAVTCALALLPAASAVAAITVQTATPFRISEARYRAAAARFNGLPRDLETNDPARFEREENRYIEALRQVDEAPVSNWDEFGDAFILACDGGDSWPGDDVIRKLVADVRRLQGRA